MGKHFASFSMHIFVLIIIGSVILQDVAGQLEPSIFCKRCPAGCTSLTGPELSCHNACRSYNTRFTVVQCKGGRCHCSQPDPVTSTAAPTARSRTRFFG